MNKRKTVFSSYSPFYDGNGEALNSAEEFDRSVFKHGVGSESGQELWSPDHRLLTHIFVQHLHPHLERETPINIKQNNNIHCFLT